MSPRTDRPEGPGPGSAETLDPQLLEILRCPACHAEFAPVSDGVVAEMTCTGCGAAYPVRGGVPILLVDEARRSD